MVSGCMLEKIGSIILWVIQWGGHFPPCYMFRKSPLESVLGFGCARLLPSGIYLARSRPPTGASERWSCPRSPGTYVCSNVWPTPLWWQPYYGNIHMYGNRVTTTWRKGDWTGVSVCPLILYQPVPPLIPLKGKRYKVDIYRNPDTHISCYAAKRIFYFVFWT